MLTRCYLQPLYLTIGPVSNVFSVHPNTADEVIANSQKENSDRTWKPKLVWAPSRATSSLAAAKTYESGLSTWEARIEKLALGNVFRMH